ncbi:MAG: SDR family NAD(P)-dependent oxidoreductase [Acidimicrobiia bacterium]
MRAPGPAERFDLSGRVALVTGGSRGLGREMVRAFAAAGADVVIASRKLDACADLAAEIEKSTGRRALVHACHVGRWEELEDLVDAAYGEFGRLDVLVNNAGMSPVYDTPADISEALWDKVLDVNLKGPFRLSALAGPRMAEAGSGSIINISSVAAVRPGPDVIPYAAAKAGLNAITVALAHAFAPAVRVNCIMAGPFLTDISQGWQAGTRESLGRLALGRAGDPSEITGAALYLASDASSFTTGAVIPVTGGTP